MKTIQGTPSGERDAEGAKPAPDAQARAPLNDPTLWRRVDAPRRRLGLRSGGTCEVYEMERSSGERTTRSLVFDWATHVRRLCEYPQDWRNLLDQELGSLAGLE